MGPGFARRTDTYEELLTASSIMICTCVVRRDVLAAAGLFDPAYRGIQDYDLWLRVARRTQIAFIDRCLASWRSHPGGTSRNWRMMYNELQRLLHHHLGCAKVDRNADAIAAAKRGLKSARISYCCTAYEHSRLDFRNRRWGSFLRNFGSCLRRSPGMVVRFLGSYLANKLRARSPRTPMVSNLAPPT